jgi:hypothetical protein
MGLKFILGYEASISVCSYKISTGDGKTSARHPGKGSPFATDDFQ